MTFRQRLTTLSAIALVLLLVVAAAGLYVPSIIAHVVEETLVQKAPAGMEPEEVRVRLRTLLSSLETRDAKLKRLLEISQTLEKVPVITRAEFEHLLMTPDS